MDQMEDLKLADALIDSINLNKAIDLYKVRSEANEIGSFQEESEPINSFKDSELSSKVATKNDKEYNRYNNPDNSVVGDFYEHDQKKSVQDNSKDNLLQKLILNLDKLTLSTALTRQEKDSGTVFFLEHHDCYKHRFSRNVSISELSSIVEKPQRIKAGKIGALIAKSRMMRYDSPIKICRSCRSGSISDSAFSAVHGSEYGEILKDLCEKASEKLLDDQVEVPSKFHQGDLYLCSESINALNGCIGCIYDGVDIAFLLHSKVHLNIRPPGHHCSNDFPSGFCWINNIHLCIEYARQTYKLQACAIIDFDLHHGDGSQKITWKMNEKAEYSVAYISLHDIDSFPCEDGDPETVMAASIRLNSHGQSIHNIHLEPFSSIEEYRRLYQEKYTDALRKAEDYLQKAQLEGKTSMIFLSAGFDACEYEMQSMQRHKVYLPLEFYETFSRSAANLADKYCGGRLLSVLEGGYSERAIMSGTFAHLVGLSQRTTSSESGGWWSKSNIIALENLYKGRKSHRKVRNKSNFAESGFDLEWMEKLQDEFKNAGLIDDVNNSVFTTPKSDRMTLRPRTPFTSNSSVKRIINFQ